MTRCMLGKMSATRSLLVVWIQKGPSMRYLDSIMGTLLKPIDRRWFQSVVDRHGADAYDKSFKSWDHLVALIFAQLSQIDGLHGSSTCRFNSPSTSQTFSVCTLAGVIIIFLFLRKIVK